MQNLNALVNCRITVGRWDEKKICNNWDITFFICVRGWIKYLNLFDVIYDIFCALVAMQYKMIIVNKSMEHVFFSKNVGSFFENYIFLVGVFSSLSFIHMSIMGRVRQRLLLVSITMTGFSVFSDSRSDRFLIPNLSEL